MCHVALDPANVFNVLIKVAAEVIPQGYSEYY